MKHRKEFEEAFGRLRPAKAIRSADDFWSDFRARVSLRVQDTVSSESARPGLRWALATACVTLVVFGAFSHSWGAGPRAGLNSVRSLEVDAAHSAVFIMNDAPTKSTILWVVYDEDIRKGEPR